MVINKQELKYIAFTVGFGILWFGFLLQYFIKVFDGQNPFLQFMLFNLGLYFMLFIFFKAMATDTGISFKQSFGFTLIFLGSDILLPEYHVTTTGQLLPGALMGVGSSDYFFGWLGQSFGLEGFILYAFVYFLVPFILFYSAAKLFPNFVKHI